MQIKKAIEKVPGGMMVIPLLLGTLINTFYPSVLEMGGFVTAISKGSGALIGAFLFCMGSGIRLKSAPNVLKRGLAITLSKFLIGVAVGLIIAKFFDNAFLGLTSLAVIAAMTNSNGGLYAALTGEYGDDTDVGAIAILSINDGPFLTMIALGATGVVSIPFDSLLGVLVPIVAGMILGNLDREMQKFLTMGGLVLIPIFAFSLGSTMNLSILLKAGLGGVVLGLMTLIIGGFFNILADRLAGGTGIAGAAASSTAGNAVATPAALLLVDPTIAGIDMATAQVAASTIITVFLVPLLTNFIYRKSRRTINNEDKKQEQHPKTITT